MTRSKDNPNESTSSQAPNRGWFGHADLVRIVALGEPTLDAVASSMGFGRVAEESRDVEVPVPVRGPVDESRPSPPQVPTPSPANRRFKKVPFLRLEKRVEREAKNETQSQVEASASPPFTARELEEWVKKRRAPTHPVLTPWSRLMTALAPRLSSESCHSAVDLDRLIDLISKGETPAELPRARRRVFIRALTIVKDISPRLRPFLADEDIVIRGLVRLLGKGVVQVVFPQEIASADGLVRSFDERRYFRRGLSGPGSPPDLAVRAAIEPGETVLCLSDLGAYANDAARETWVRTGRRLSALGARTIALLPCPEDRWPRECAEFWECIAWERSERAESGDGDSRAQKLLQMLLPTLLVQPGLLRRVRRLLPRAWADVGTEADVWNHADVQREYGGIVLSEKLAATRSEFYDDQVVGPDLRRKVVSELRAWHSRETPELWHLEVLGINTTPAGGQSLVKAAEVAAAREFVRRIETSARERAGQIGSTREQTRGFARESVQEMMATAELCRDDRLRAALSRLWAELNADSKTASPPPHADLGIIARHLAAGQPSLALDLRQVGSRLKLAMLTPFSAPLFGSWCSTASLPEKVFVSVGDTNQAKQVDVDPGVTIPWAERGPSSLKLTTDREDLEFGVLRRPHWAHGLGRDRYGLFAEIKIGDVKWKMRWIPPGSFLMGSPEEEKGRVDSEGPQHRVTISRGYWLAETPCTQAQWLAVMGGENPSRFKKSKEDKNDEWRRRPVEMVSHEDAERFCRRVDELLNGLGDHRNRSVESDEGQRFGENFRLPSEVEWEYACRAGTTTSTFAGDFMLDDDRAAPGLDEIAWFSRDSRKSTHPVGATRRNPWGLYDVLGNVYEWCFDGMRDYGTKAEPDPVGPVGGSFRVLRGGTWNSYARYCRSAYRDWNPPADRYGWIGFRLARGQALPGQKKSGQ